jgi:hypothetical protein
MSNFVIVHDSGDGVVVTSPADDSLVPAILGTLVSQGAAHAVVSREDMPEGRYWGALAVSESGNVSLDPAKKAAIDTQEELAGVELWFNEEIAKGLTVADGWRLGMQTEDVTLLTGHYILAKEAAALGMAIPPLIDADGVPHEFEEIEELTAIMLAYGQRRAEISGEYAAKKAAILSGET